MSHVEDTLDESANLGTIKVAMLSKMLVVFSKVGHFKVVAVILA